MFQSLDVCTFCNDTFLGRTVVC